VSRESQQCASRRKGGRREGGSPRAKVANDRSEGLEATVMNIDSLATVAAVWGGRLHL